MHAHLLVHLYRYYSEPAMALLRYFKLRGHFTDPNDLLFAEIPLSMINHLVQENFTFCCKVHSTTELGQFHKLCALKFAYCL